MNLRKFEKYIIDAWNKNRTQVIDIETLLYEIKRNKKWLWLLQLEKDQNDLFQFIFDEFHDDTVLTASDILNTYLVITESEEPIDYEEKKQRENAIKIKIHRYLNLLKHLDIIKNEVLPRMGRRHMTILWIAPFFKKDDYMKKKKKYLIIGEATKTDLDLKREYENKKIKDKEKSPVPKKKPSSSPVWDDLGICPECSCNLEIFGNKESCPNFSRHSFVAIES